MKAKHSYSSQPFLHCNTRQKGLGLFIKCLANKGPVNWQAIAFTASYHNLWESFRPKSISHTSVPTRCHTHSHLKPLTSATAVSHKNLCLHQALLETTCNPFIPCWPAGSFLFVCLLTLTRFFVFCDLTALFSLQDSSLPLQGVSYSRDICSRLHCSPMPIENSPLIRGCLLTALLYC